MINNKYIQNIFVSFFLMASLFVSAQFTLNSHNNGWVQVNGSSGVTVKNVVVNQLQMNGPLNIKNWSIVGRVVSPIVNSEKKRVSSRKTKTTIQHVHSRAILRRKLSNDKSNRCHTKYNCDEFYSRIFYS